MICVRYLSLNRTLLLTIGLWPYEQSKLVRLQFILFFSISISFIVFQFTTFVTSRCTSQLTVEILSITSILICPVIKYISFYFNMDVVKHLLELLHHIYDELIDKSEIEILEKYLSIGKRYTEIFTLFAIGGLFCVILAPFSPRFLDIVWPANESRSSLSVQIVTEYFVDQEKYFYLIILYISIAFCIGGITMLGTGTILLIYFQHICGMLRIASYRMERAMEINIRQMNGRNVNSVYKDIAYAVDMHRNAIEFLNILISTFNIMFFFLLVIGLFGASLNLFRIFQEISSEFIMEKVIQSFVCLSVYYVYTFIGNYIAQQVVDHNKHVFATVYNVQWYVAPLRVQKLILFLLQKGTKEIKLVIGGLFIGSLEGFTTLASASIYYFTVLYSTRKEPNQFID